MTQKQISPNTAQYDIRVQLRERVATEAAKAYETSLSKGDFKSAVRIAKEHELGEDIVKDTYALESLIRA